MKAMESVEEINTAQLLLRWKTREKRHVRERVGKGTFKLSTNAALLWCGLTLATPPLTVSTSFLFLLQDNSSINIENGEFISLLHGNETDWLQANLPNLRRLFVEARTEAEENEYSRTAVRPGPWR